MSEDATHFLYPERRCIAVTGADRVAWLHGMLTCDLQRASNPQEAVYGLSLSVKGRILGDVLVLAGDDELRAWVPTQALEALVAHWEHAIVMEDVELLRRDEARLLLVLSDRSPLERVAYRTVELGLPALLHEFDLGEQAELERAQRAANLRELAAPAYLQRRIDSAWPVFGDDFGPDTYAQEIGLEQRAVSFQKGCYVGQEVVAMLQHRGRISRRLVQLERVGPLPLGDERGVVDAQGKEVGRVTSVAPDGRYALALVKLAAATVDTELRVGPAQVQVRRWALT